MHLVRCGTHPCFRFESVWTSTLRPEYSEVSHTPIFDTKEYEYGGASAVKLIFGAVGLCRQSDLPGDTNQFHQIYQGVVPTSNENTSHFLLGFSYYYSGFAFYWDGAGEAFFRLGESTETQAVGNSWSNATGVPASGEIVLGLNIASTAATAQAHGEPGQGGLVAYKIPDNLDLD
ncbi:hypothetical protein FB45DRAFT_883358 [Roridomyces roridus]|uniref:Uncharacterized protein n=1 Tax=Roridomyces roridus TaxID=1738132 RepID=A0AAD7F5H3_9AGAR|nr:hypothetical protein FB45DRAFT_883358 [Roridomyces roridus]